jgi:acetyl-CoA synthetase
MGLPPLAKSADRRAPEPNLGDYAQIRREFTWDAARARLDGLDGGLNIAHEAVDRHAVGDRGEHLAIRWLGKKGEVRDFTYAQLRDLTNRFANLLGELGLERGERVFLLAPRLPELYVAALGSLKYGCVVCPLFAAFGPDPIKTRAERGEARVLVTTTRLFRRKVSKILGELPTLEHVILIDADEDVDGALALHPRLDAMSAEFSIPHTDPEDLALIHFTSGTTGKPKGAAHVHAAVVVHHMTGTYALDLHPDDVYWCTADPGWVTGTSYGIIAPLTHGVTMIVDEEEFDPERWYEILEQQRVNVWYTAPTAIRMLMRAGPDPAASRDLSRLRLIASVGEPLNPEAVVWGRDVLGLPIHDNWWQSETGGIMISNYRSLDIRPGSMGKPLPGIEAAIVERREDGSIEMIEAPGTSGELALRAGWPSMFRDYLGAHERYQSCFQDGWYLTGDLAQRDEDGYFWFVGRADDVIKSAGHLIGPFEVESALVEHPAVAEAAVIGMPDEVAGAIVKAFVSLHHGHVPSSELRRELMASARKKLGPAVAPREIEFREDLPKTRSGKIMRRLLKARELGLPEGDTSTLEGAE